MRATSIASSCAATRASRSPWKTCWSRTKNRPPRGAVSSRLSLERRQRRVECLAQGFGREAVRLGAFTGAPLHAPHDGIQRVERRIRLGDDVYFPLASVDTLER